MLIELSVAVFCDYYADIIDVMLLYTNILNICQTIYSLNRGQKPDVS